VKLRTGDEIKSITERVFFFRMYNKGYISVFLYKAKTFQLANQSISGHVLNTCLTQN
jgi:hypothetical protein